MKKMLVLALVMASFVGQAHAEPGKRAKELKAREAQEMALRSKVLSRTSPAVTEAANKLSASNLDKSLSPMEAKTLAGNLTKNGELVETINEIVAQTKSKPALRELGKARVKGVLMLSKATFQSAVKNLDYEFGLPEERATQDAAILIKRAGKEASNFTPESAALVEKSINILVTARSNGKSFVESMREVAMEVKKADLAKVAGDQVKTEKIIEKFLKELKNLCKA